MKERPQFVLFHQWNEFTGQAEGYPYESGIYGDRYNVELSDDIEPVSLTMAGYRGDQGGWGFLYANLTQALVDLYKQATPQDSLLAVYSPRPGQIITGNTVPIAWELICKPAASFSILLDGAKVLEGVQGHEYTLDIATLGPGKHVITVVAEGAVTHYSLAHDRMGTRLADAIPVRGEVTIVHQ